MKSSVTKAFRKQLDRLPAAVQDQAEKAYKLWREDPYHNSLQFKRVSQRQPIYSADHIYWFWIGGHDEYDELLKRL